MATDSNKTIQALRAALAVSPDNTPLRLHLAETLLELEAPEEAEQELKLALARDPGSAEVKLALVRAYERQGKHSVALVIIEQLVAERGQDAGLRLEYVRVLLRAGQVAEARRAYDAALALDPHCREAQLDRQFGSVGCDDRAPERAAAAEVDGRVRAAADEDFTDADVITELEDSDITFADVGGMERVKDEIRMKIILPLSNKDLFAAYGKKVGGGILMYGPPGCGKTYLARATAGQVKAKFINVGLNDILNMWIGQSEERLHQVFQQARRNRPCVLFFDEVDALGAKRSDMRQSAGRHLINQFLAELDGVDVDNEGILTLAATNAPWHLDGAFRRPGRFDRIVFVPPPDPAARAEILRLLMRQMPTEAIDYDGVAARLSEYSGADLRAVVDTAVEAKLREALRGVPRAAPVTGKDLLAAAKQVRPSTKEWFSTARNHAVYANDAGLYDDVLAYLKL